MLVRNPNLALPNAAATVDNRKFTHYLFGGTNEKGLAKGRAFTSRLGYDINNYDKLIDEILKKTERYPAKFKGNNGHGDKYEQNMILYGLKNKPADVLIGWLNDSSGVHLTTLHLD